MFLFERRWCNSTSALPVPTLPLLHGEPQAPGGGGPASSFFFLKLERPSQSPRYRRPEDICGARRKLSLACGSSRFSASRGRETAGKQVPLPAPEPERTRVLRVQLWTRGAAFSPAPGPAGSSGTPHTQAHSPQRKAAPFQGSQPREYRGSE